MHLLANSFFTVKIVLDIDLPFRVSYEKAILPVKNMFIVDGIELYTALITHCLGQFEAEKSLQLRLCLEI